MTIEISPNRERTEQVHKAIETGITMSVAVALWVGIVGIIVL